MADWIGYRWLAEHYGVEPAQPFRVDSQLARSRATVRENSYVHEFYLPAARPADTLAGHMAFALKHEGIHLEFLARLLAQVPSDELDQWITAEPTGQYARRAGFFYEFLTGRRLTFSGVTSGNYVNALHDEAYLTASAPDNNPRWRIRNNLPGTREYCPIVARTDRVRHAERYDCAQRLQALETEFGSDLLLRSAVWLTVKESRASFAIEHEEQHVDRVKRFASVMEQRCGQYENPLDPTSIMELQREILGPRATRYGIRQSPVFVGEVDGFMQVVHYIAPHWNDAPGMLAGLREFSARTAGRSPLIRAAVLSFGFVYIHPMSDGNGRISRFLINDVLRRDRAIPDPFILPVSATITSTPAHRRGYDHVLEVFSKPFMRRYATAYRFVAERTAEDGVPYNLEFDNYEEASAAWRYPDLTEHTEYLAHIVEVTIEQEMRKEAGYLRSLRAARARLKEIIEGPDADIDRIIRSIRENGGQLSNKLKHTYPQLADPEIGGEVIAAIMAAFVAH